MGFPSTKQSKVIFSDLSLPKSPSDLSSKMANKIQKRSKRNKRSSLRRDKRSSLRRNKRSSRYETHSKLSSKMRQNTRTSNGFINRNIKQWTNEEYDFKMKEIDDMQSKIAYLSSKIEYASIDTSKTSKIKSSECQSEREFIGALSYKAEEPEHVDFGMRQFKKLKKNKLNEKIIGIIDRTVVNKQ